MRTTVRPFATVRKPRAIGYTGGVSPGAGFQAAVRVGASTNGARAVVRVQCPYCHRRYRTELEAFGRTAVCTKCSETFKIGESRPPFEWKPTSLAEDSWIGVPPPEEKREIKHCILCDAPMEPHAAICPECRANQITGTIERVRPRVAARGEPAWWSVLPVRRIAIVLLVAAVLAGLFWAVRAMTRSAIKAGEDIAEQARALEAVRYFQDTGDPGVFARQYAGTVTDDNLPRYTGMLTSPNPAVREAAVLLIGCGRITRLDPLLSLSDKPETIRAAHEALNAIGSRRLVELSVHADAQVRQQAARALCLISDLPMNEVNLKALAEAGSAGGKIQVLNRLCGAWPDATGMFVVTINGVSSPFTVRVDQIGRTFYLVTHTAEFRTSADRQRRFEIPIEQWCSATGAAVSAAAVRKMLAGSVTLISQYGVTWEGIVQVKTRQPVIGPLPGFLPFDAPEPGRVAQVPVRLDRPGR